MPVQQTAVKADPLIQVRAVLRGEPIHLRALADYGSLNLFYYRTFHHVVSTMVRKVVA